MFAGRALIFGMSEKKKPNGSIILISFIELHFVMKLSSRPVADMI